eukprot:3195311-Prymnesium_polylepis.1
MPRVSRAASDLADESASDAAETSAPCSRLIVAACRGRTQAARGHLTRTRREGERDHVRGARAGGGACAFRWEVLPVGGDFRSPWRPPHSQCSSPAPWPQTVPPPPPPPPRT